MVFNPYCSLKPSEEITEKYQCPQENYSKVSRWGAQASICFKGSANNCNAQPALRSLLRQGQPSPPTRCPWQTTAMDTLPSWAWPHSLHPSQHRASQQPINARPQSKRVSFRFCINSLLLVLIFYHLLKEELSRNYLVFLTLILPVFVLWSFTLSHEMHTHEWVLCLPD